MKQPHLMPFAGLLLASCWLLAGLLLASCWLLGFLLASSFPTRISLENRFFKRFTKPVNSLHCFSNGFVVSWGFPPPFGASSWPLAGLLLGSCRFLLASCWPLAGLLLASCWPLAGLLLASWPLAGLLASCWLLRLSWRSGVGMKERRLSSSTPQCTSTKGFVVCIGYLGCPTR